MTACQSSSQDYQLFIELARESDQSASELSGFVLINLSISLAARLAAPIALITVAEPVIMSPPAHTRGLVVRPVASSQTIVPFWVVLRLGVD